MAVAVALLFLSLVSCCLAEDWTVNGKDYHNVTVSLVSADKVHILYAGGSASINLSDLPPEIQKELNYDPKAAAAAQARAADAQTQAAALAKATAAQNAAAAALLASANNKQNTGSVAAVANHSMEMIGTISEAKKGNYTVSCLGYNDILPSAMMTVSDYLQKNPGYKKAPGLAMPKGGKCVLVTPASYSMNQAIDIVVYSAGMHLGTDGNKYAQFSDNAVTAAQLAQPGTP